MKERSTDSRLLVVHLSSRRDKSKNILQELCANRVLVFFTYRRENCFLTHLTQTEVGKGPAFAIRTKNNSQLFLRLRRRPHSSRRDNQTKRVCKLACKRASADCSAVARRMRALCVAPSGNACTASEYNFSFADFHTKKCSAHAGHFLFSLEYRGANEAHLRCMKNGIATALL